MKCAVHPEVDATGYCRNCGKPMCPACVRPVRDVLYCEDCLANVMGIPVSAPVSTGSVVNPSVGVAPGNVAAQVTASASGGGKRVEKRESGIGVFIGIGAGIRGDL